MEEDVMLAVKDLHRYRVDTWPNGDIRLCIREIRPDDKEMLLEHFTRLSPDASYLRFFGIRRTFSLQELRSLTELNFPGSAALVATVDEPGGRESIVGESRYFVLREGGHAELALSVIDAYQGMGIGSLLLGHIAELALRADIRELRADIMGSNRGAHEFFARRGFEPIGTMDGICRVKRSLAVETES